MKRSAFLFGLVVLLFACERDSSVLPASTISKPAPTIELPEHHRAELAPGEQHLFEIALEQGQALHLLAQQTGVDIALELSDSKENLLLSVDAPTAAQGPEELWFMADNTGRYLIRIRAGGRTKGSYTLKSAFPDPEDREFQARLKAFNFNQSHQQTAMLDDLERRVLLWQRTTHARETAIALFDLAEALTATHLPRAILSFEAAWLLLRENNQPIWSLYVGNRLAYHYYLNGELNRANNQWETTLALARIHGDPWWQAYTLKQMGVAAHAIQSHIRAISYFKESLALFERVRDFKQVGKVNIRLAQTHIVVGRLHEAEDALDRAEAVYVDRANTTSILLQRGWLNLRQGNYTQAESLTLKALDLKQGPAHGIYDRLGTIYREQGLFEAAAETYAKALAILAKQGRPDQVAMVQANMARNLALQKRFDEIDLSESLKIFKELAHAEGLLEVHSLLAEQALYRNQLFDALSHYEAALQALEKGRGSIPSTTTAQPYVADRFAVIATTRDLLFELDTQFPNRGYRERAFALIEKVRARTLRESLSFEKEPAQPSSHQLQEAVNQLELQRLQARDEGDLERVQMVSAAIRDKLLELSLLKPTLQPKPAHDLKTIRAELLNEQRRLLVYALGEPMSHAFVVGPHSISRYELAPAHRIRAGVEGLMNAVKGHNPIQTKLLSRKLAQYLLEPMLEEITEKSLIIIKDEGLHTLPFAMLRDPVTDRYLIQDWELSELPSASIGVYLKRRAAKREASNLEPAIFADPVYAERSVVGLGEIGSAFGSGVFRELRWSAKEAEMLGRLLPKADFFQRHQASRSQLLQLEGQRRAVLHFAVHGLLDTEEQLSGLVLSLEDSQGYQTAGFLRVHQLERMNLPVDLVVLSACQTARGKIWRGENPIGPGRAFLTAGATHVVMSSWRIQDGEATVALMKQFYEGLLQQKLEPNQALRQAQIAMIEQAVTPYVWASFLVIGPPQNPSIQN
jgi:CHAT domain-containing protein